jgi:DNA-binding response OmpR family regulator
MSVAAPVAPLGSRILVIEDESKMARLLSRALSAVGFEVMLATDGREGLDMVRSHPFELVILDLMLPDVDGFSVLSAAAELEDEPAVLVVSAVGDVGSKVLCLELGACDYLTKPFQLPELIARIRLRLRETARTQRRRRIQCGRWALDLQRRVVEDGERVITLSTREFLLLEYLMERVGEACTRDDILQHVWGYDFDPGTNVVDVCVGRMRQKLGGDCVTTVRNVGYCFVGA